MKRILALALPLLLAACGTLPQPFLGRPGKEGARLAVPPPPVLVVPPPREALLGNGAASLFAHDIAKALVAQDVPSIARVATAYDWRLKVTATQSGGLVTPEFAIVGPNLKTYGHASGTPVPAAGWADGDPGLLKGSATGIAPELARQLGAINAVVQQSNPKSLANRPAHLLVAGVHGAPGDGDHSLALDVTRDLPRLGLVVVDSKDEADFVVEGRVKVTPNSKPAAGGASDLVELVWTVRSQSGAFIGKVTQLHDLQPREMAPYWGDVAAAAAHQAALGIREVIANATPKPGGGADAGKMPPQAGSRPARSPEG